MACRAALRQLRNGSNASQRLDSADRCYKGPMEGELCRLCGGDGRIGNALGRSTATCPGCHGSGRRADTSSRFHDVTKTKQSHYQQARTEQPTGPKAPVTAEGAQLAREVAESTVLPADAKTRLLA